MHSGHLESLRFAKSKGDKLIVAVNGDASVSRLKGPKRPVVPLDERMEMLAALECVDYVISFDNLPDKLNSMFGLNTKNGIGLKFTIDEIKHYSKDKQKLETILQANKFNL